jgi:hypothetical protein
MGFMMNALTDTLKDLKEEMREIKGRVSDGTTAALEHPTEQASPSPAWRAQPAAVEPADWWYAVSKGKNGASGVFPTWTEASHLVLGVSGAAVKKFREYKEANDYVRSRQSPSPRDRSQGSNVPTTEMSVQTWYAIAKGKHGVCNLSKSWEETSEFFLGVPGALVQKFGTRGEALSFLEDHQPANPEERTSVVPETLPQPQRPINAPPATAPQPRLNRKKRTAIALPWC